MIRFSEYLLNQLHIQGVKHYFHLPGSAIIQLFDGLNPRDCILMKSPLGVGFAADAYARVNGISAAIVAQGPGILELIPALTMSKRDHVSVIAITAKPDYMVNNSTSWQAFPLVKTLEALQIPYFEIDSVENASEIIQKAICTARSPIPTPIVINCLSSVLGQMMQMPVNTNSLNNSESPMADTSEWELAYNRIVTAKKPCFVFGRGTIDCAEIVLTLLEKSNIPSVTTLPARGVIPESHPGCFGSIGSIGFPSANQVLKDSDCIIAIGTTLCNTTVHPLITGNHLTEIIQVVPDTKDFCKALPVKQRILTEPSLFVYWLAEQKFSNIQWVNKTDEIPPLDDVLSAYMQQLFSCISPDSTLCVDAGLSCVIVHRLVKCRFPFQILFPWSIASMGYAIPSAIAATIAGRSHVVAIAGDGGALMSLAELSTIAQYHLPITIVVFNNRTQGFIKMLSKTNLHFDYGSHIDFVQTARGLGIESIRIQSVQELTDYLNPKNDDCPCLIEINTDFEVIDLNNTQWKQRE